MINTKYIIYFLRFSLAASYISALADRFGLWGSSGSNGVVWGNYNAFLEYTQYLNPWAPQELSNLMGHVATALEALLGLFLIIGFKIKLTSLASFTLLMIFALSMTFFTGIKGALDYNVFTAAAASLLLYTVSKK